MSIASIERLDLSLSFFDDHPNFNSDLFESSRLPQPPIEASLEVRDQFENLMKGQEIKTPRRYDVMNVDLKNAVWEENGESKGVKLYKATIKRGEQEITAYRGVLGDVFDISPEQFVRGVMNVDHYVGNIDYVENIEKISEQNGELIYYMYLNFGLGVQRHNVLQMQEEQTGDPNLSRVSYEREPFSAYPEVLNKHKDDAVECPINEGSWEYNLATGELSQTLLVVSGGKIPNWMSNAGTNSAIPSNVLGMHDFIKKFGND